MTQRQIGTRLPSRATIRLLDDLPQAADALPADSVEAARQALLAESIHFSTGPWQAPPTDGLIALVVLEGFLVHRVELGAATASELIGPGDLFRPWGDDHDGLIPARSRFSGLSHGRFAVLDSRSAAGIARFPELLATLETQSAQRAQRLFVMSAVGHMKRIEDRLILFFAHAASEWGRVTSEGIVLPLSMPHALIADLIGAERPSVTTSLGRLRNRGLVTRRSDRTWVLAHEIAEVALSASQSSREVAPDLQLENAAPEAQPVPAIRKSRAMLPRVAQPRPAAS